MPTKRFLKLNFIGSSIEYLTASKKVENVKSRKSFDFRSFV